MLVALIASVALADHPAGVAIDEAASMVVTADGLAVTGDLVPALLPSQVDLDPVEDSGGSWCFNYAYRLTDAWVGVEVDAIRVVPTTDLLTVEADLTVWINDASDKFLLWYEVACADEDCPGYVEPFSVTASMPFSLEVVEDAEGTRTVDATLGAIGLVHGLTKDRIQLDCNIDSVEEAMNWFGLSLYDLLIEQAEGAIQDELEDSRADLEATIEEALLALNVDQTVEVGEVPLHLVLAPYDVRVTTAGLELVMSGLAEAPAESCVAEWDPGTSPASESAAPAASAAPSGTDAGLLLSDDLGDQALYALWRGGLLCTTLSDDGSLPLPLDTTLLGVLAGDAFDELFPESKPMILQTAPRRQPTLAWDAGADATVHVEELGLDLFAELDHRTAHVLGLDLATEVAVDLDFDATTGTVDASVAIPEEAVVATVGRNELVPDANAEIEATASGAIASLAGSLLGGVLGDVSFTLPAYEGIGVTSLDAAPAGDEDDWLGAWIGLGAVSYGEGSEGCSGGCSTGSPAGLIALLLAAIGIRRRRG